VRHVTMNKTDPNLVAPSAVRDIALAVCLLGACLAPTSVWSQTATAAGEVEFARGVGFAQATGQTPRTLGKGLPLQEGDRVTTADGASAVIKLQDGTRMTVRPNSEIVLSQFKFKENATDNSMVMQLVRGGLRAITGLVAKSSPNAARIQTATATIGIRGTDFDARICRADCGKEAQAVDAKQRIAQVQASAKVVTVKGALTATDAQGTRRSLVEGGPVYPGDLVETSPSTQAVLAFRDDSRVSLGAQTRFRVDNFVFDNKNPQEGRFLVSLLRGSARALTGLIAKANNRNVTLQTATATIGIRGTGVDLDCVEATAAVEVRCDIFNWLGSVVVTPQGQTDQRVLTAGGGLSVTPSGVRPISDSPAGTSGLQRPDQVQVNLPALFTGSELSESEEGLFVFVRDGHIEIDNGQAVLHLGRGEPGYQGSATSTRLNTIPRFIDFDPIVLPSSRNPNAGSVLGTLGLASRVCRG
jgi:hypothetical protein